MRKIPTPMKSIRLKCLDCCCGQTVEVRECPSDDCPLHPYRMGHNPETVEKMKAKRAATVAKK